MSKIEDKYKNEKAYFSHIFKYSKFMKDKVDHLYEMREKELKKIKGLAEEEIKKIDEDTTEVTYELGVEISMPIPAMMRKKAEQATIDQALQQLKSHLEE